MEVDLRSGVEVPMTMHTIAFSLLSAAFGPPECSTTRLEIWSVPRPAPRSAVSVILVAAAEDAEVWIFDSLDLGAGGAHYRIAAESALDPVLADIRARLGPPAACRH